jgi:hypothetical protein
LSAAQEAAYRSNVTAFGQLVGSTSAGNVTATVNIVTIADHPLSSFSSGCGGPYVTPGDVQADVDRYAPGGSYDSIIVGWSPEPTAGHTNPPMAYRGCSVVGQYAGSHGATWTTVLSPYNADLWWWNGEYPGEVFLHEWLIPVTWWFGDHGFPTTPSVEGDVSLYGVTTDAQGSWRDTWYAPLMRGTLSTAGGKSPGITTMMWRTVKPAP